MSLIVQVNANGAGTGSAPQQSGHHLPHREQATLVTQIPSPTLQTSQPPLSVLSRVANQQLSGLTRITTAGGAQHVVQHHPPPLRMVHLPNGNQIPVSAATFSALSAGNNVVTTVALPMSPAPVSIRQILPQTPVGRPPQLPRSPVRQHQLPQTPILRHQMTAGNNMTHHQRLIPGPGQAMRTYHQMKVGGPTGTIMVTQRQQPTLTMLPQAPNPGMLPNVPSPGMMPAGSNLMTFPLKIQSAPMPPHQQLHQHQQHHPQQMSVPIPSVVSSSSSTILPPNTLHHQLFPATCHNDSDDFDVADDPPAPNSFLRGGRAILSSPRQKDKRSLPGQLALQDHNYVTKLPPTPPPASPPPILRDVLEEHHRRQQQLLLHERHQTSFKEFEERLQDYSFSALTAASQLIKAEPAGLAEVVNDPPGSNATAGEPIGTCVLPSRVQANLNSIEEAGVGPMAPLVDDDLSRMSVSSNDERGGEETETAPEAEGEDDSVTRCICDFLHDDGYMICCDKCLVWQHVVCMGLDKNNIPDEYLCEVCKPRPIDRKKARMMQSKLNTRREELLTNAMSSDDERRNGLGVRRPRNDAIFNVKKRPSGGIPPSATASSSSAAVNKKIIDRKADFNKSSPILGSVNRKTKFTKKNSSILEKNAAARLATTNAANLAGVEPTTNGKDVKVKKTYRKRKGSEKLTTPAAERRLSGGKKVPRRKSTTTLNTDSDAESRDGGAEEELEDVDRNQQHLRSWIDQYEEAVTNHYSPELRARLSGNKFAGLGNELRSNVIGGPTRCNVSLKGNGVKILTASVNLSSNTPIIECKGKLMLSSQFRSTTRGNVKGHSPFVFFYQLGEIVEIALDEKTYGNDSRFCRRSTNYNAELRHVVDKGSLHLFIVSVKSVDKNQEILLPLENSVDSNPAPLPSINADLREIKKPANGLLNTSTDDEPLASRDIKERKKKERKKAKRFLPTTNEESPIASRKTRAQHQTLKSPNPEVEVKTEVKEEIEEKVSPVKLEQPKPIIKEEEESFSDNEKPPIVNGRDEHHQSPHEHQEPQPTEMLSPIKGHHHKTSPSGGASKLGLPDNKGLIVGVNTINYDASSSVRNKAKSREERKMEMIMKAFEAMERAEQRRKESVSEGREEKTVTPGIGGPKRRRRSSSSFKMMANADSNLDVSSADESKPEPKRTKRKGRKSGPTTPQRRRSRILSGGTASALSTDEDHVTGNAGGSQDATSTPSGMPGGPFRFPKTKKSLMTDWLQESNDMAVSNMQNDDDVSANYLRGSRSPPGIATHLLRSSAPLSPVKNVCSAKKRWLRQAISEDHTEDGPVNGNASPSSEACYVDYVTPLKKRRLASYKDDQDHNSDSSSRMPNGLKNKLMSNLVLEAVLDRALEDMGGSVARSASVDSMASPAAESSMSMRSPDQSPSKELQSEDACSSRDAYPDDSPDLKHDEEEEATFECEEEEFVNNSSHREQEEDEDEQVEVEETSSHVGDEEEEVSQQSREVDEELADISKEDVEDDDEAEEDVEIEEPEDEAKSVEAADTLDDDANFAEQSKDDFEEDDKDERNVEQNQHQHQPEFQPLDEDARQESPAEEEKNNLKEREVSSGESSQTATNNKLSVTPIKTPEPSSVFKSFFTSNVSIEALEAEIEASKKARLVEDQKLPPIHILTGESFLPEPQSSLTNCEPMSDVSFTSTASVPEETAEQFGRMSSDRRDSETSTVESVKESYIHVQNNHEDQTSLSNFDSTSKSKPKEKKRFSLADYKKRRQTEGIPIQSETSTSNRVDDRDGPGTPTQDEELATLAAPPTLNTLPLFEKLEKLEKAQKESKKKVQSNLGGLDGTLNSPPEPKREDLTERLKKEFGLKIDEEEETRDGDQTPETESPPPPPPISAPPTAIRFTPTQYPSYPSNYPLPYPSTKFAPISSTVTSSSSVGATSHPPSTPYSRDSLSYPPPLPPPPPAPVIANAPHPPPPPVLSSSRLDNDASLHSSRSNGTSSASLNNRRPGISSSSTTVKDYYPHNSSSRGYYPNSSSGGRRERDHRDHRERDREYHHRPPSGSSSSTSSSSASRRNPFHSGRSYY